MSTTVVGACILAALVIGKPLIKEGSDRRTYEQHHEYLMDEDEPKAEDEDEIMEVDPPGDNIEAHISGEHPT